MKLFERAGRDVVFNPQGLEPNRVLPFTCLGSECPNTCCGPFHGTRAVDATVKQEDLGKIIGKDPDTDPDRVSIFAQIRLTETDIERLRNAGNDWLMIRRGDTSTRHYYMRLQEDGSCAALAADGMCSVHASRPTICRAFPFYIDLFAGLSMVNSCPGVGAGEQTVERLMPEITAAADMYEFWIQEIKPRVL